MFNAELSLRGGTVAGGGRGRGPKSRGGWGGGGASAERYTTLSPAD